MDVVFNYRPTMIGIITGAVAGLAAITPAAGYVNLFGAIAIGAASSAICYGFVALVKTKFGYDDSLDAFGVHGVGGVWGVIATGLFATTSVNAAGANGLFHGNAKLLVIQVTAAIITFVYSFGASFALLKLVNAFMPMRATADDERIGLDLTMHREAAYTVID
jgi:Amt family ammonium transporter